MREALRKNADWVFMWDDDTEIKDDTFFTVMTETAYKHDAAVVGLPYRLGASEESIFNVALKGPQGYTYYRQRPAEPQEDNDIGASPEDWHFCEGIKQRGGKVLLEPRIRTVHWKLVGLTF